MPNSKKLANIQETFNIEILRQESCLNKLNNHAVTYVHMVRAKVQSSPESPAHNAICEM